MKKAFTMIELIFVIVILGILAAVAIPRLNATRDDAEISKSMNNFATLINDLTSYYTANGNFSDKGIGLMTNVPLEPINNNTLSNYPAANFKIGKKNCIYVEAEGRAGKETNYIRVRGTGNNDRLCADLITKINNMGVIAGAYKENTFKTKADGLSTNQAKTLFVKVGSNSVSW